MGSEAMATITVEVTQEQWRQWCAAAGNSDLHAYLVKAGTFYAERLAARLELARRLEKDGRL